MASIRNIAAILIVSVAFLACKTMSPGKSRAKNFADSVSATAVRNFDVKTLKSHLANVKNNEELSGQFLWAMLLVEPSSDGPCPGLAQEKYFFVKNLESHDGKISVAEGNPMPMNGPCGLVFDVQEKSANDVGGTLMGSSPLAEIGTLDRIKYSVGDAIKSAESRYKTFKYKEAVKVLRLLQPDHWDDPWFWIYGEACGQQSSVMMNARTGVFLETMDTPPAKCSN
jgi:hypothetical protein